ncbi:MAG: hypothetical protein Q7T45_22750 [Bradyrhizobium sp.]|nr:hypothetical protein [Bradyrhizobium sp.]MDO8400638.1 hypothetical protein [Bradyrhizobium sp.]
MKTRWSFKDQRRLIEIAASEKSVEEVAVRIGRTPRSVRRMALQLGISLKFKTGRARRQAPRLRAKGKW